MASDAAKVFQAFRGLPQNAKSRRIPAASPSDGQVMVN
jgi:hypothetical protein